MDARVAAERAPFAIHDGAAPEARRRLPLDEACVVAVGHEADLLALRLVRRGQPARGGQAADLVLGQVADREYGARELLRGQAEQEVRLVLPPVAAAQQAPPPRARVAVRARVMAGGHVLDPQGARALDQALELHLRVAARA